MKKLLTLFAVLTFTVSLAACNNTPAFDEADLRLANTAMAEDLDIHTTSLSSDFLMLGQIGEGLLRLGEGDGLVDGIAKEYTISEDGQTYTFTLREGAKWSNGDEITAEDFVYSWQRAVNPDTVAKYASMFDIIENGNAIRTGQMDDVTKLGVTANGDYELVVELTKPVPYFLQLTAFPALYPAHQDTIEQYGKDYGKEADKIAFNGPFTVTYWNTDYGIYLEKNEDYWDADSVNIETVSYRLVEDPNTLLSLYDNDQTDRVGITGTQYEARKSEAEISAVPTMWYMITNSEDDKFENKNLRKAIQYGIDKTELVQALLPYEPSDAFVPRGYASVVMDDGTSVDFRDFHTTDAGSELPDFTYTDGGIYDEGEAQTFLNAALDELDSSVLNEDGSLTVNFTAFDSAGWQPLFENIQAQLNELEGLTVELDKKGGSAVYDDYDAGTFEFGFYGWGPDYPDPMTFLELYHSEDSHNSTIVNPEGTKPAPLPEYDTLIERARDLDVDNSVLADPVARYRVMGEAEEILLESAYIIPLAQKAGGIITNDRVSGLIRHNFGPDYSYKWVEVSE